MRLLLNTKTLTQFIFKSTYLAVIAIFLLDFFFYFGFVKSNFISPIIIAFIVLVIHLAIRKFTNQRLSDDFVRSNFYIFTPGSLLLALSAYFIEEYGFFFPNYFFSNFEFHYHALPLFVIPTVGFATVHAGSKFWKENWSSLYFMLMTSIVVGAALVFYTDNDFYRSMIVEDGVIESLTAISFALSGLLALSLARNRRHFSHLWERRLYMFGCIFVGLSLLLVAGEEISWGQRVFNLMTPEQIAIQNRQNEITIHNSELFWPFVYVAYWLIGGYGMIVWILEWMVRDVLYVSNNSAVWRSILVPRGYLFINFGLISLYVWLRHTHGPWKYHAWEEFSELLLVVGIMTHLIETHVTFPKKRN